MKIKKIILAFILSLTISTFSLNAATGDDAYNYLKVIDTTYQKRTAGSEKELEMANYLKKELDSFGYSATLESFSYTKSNKTVNSQNVVAIKKGKSEKQIIVGAHYDSVGTNGVDDNGSGVVVTLETAKKLAKENTDYTIVFIFFGCEETGLNGSKAYANNMSQDEINKTILMVNLDSVLAGTYPYIYGGSVENGKAVDTWGYEQGMQLSKELNLGLKNNDTELNYDYPTPTTGNWSDHASFKNKGITHVYLEASNWDVLDDPNYPEDGTSGAAETEIGAVMHVPARDNLAFIEGQWGTRGKDNITTYTTFLYNYVKRVDPAGLKKVELPLYKTAKNGNSTYYYKLVNNKYLNYKKVVVKNNVTTTYNYTLTTPKKLKSISKITKVKTKVTKKEYYTYNSKALLANKKVYNLNKSNKYIKTYNKNVSYYSNKKVKTYTVTKKNTSNKNTLYQNMKYTSKGKKSLYTKFNYYKTGIKSKKYVYDYNSKGQLKSFKKDKAIRYVTTYSKKGKKVQTIKKYYTAKGKLSSYWQKV